MIKIGDISKCQEKLNDISAVAIGKFGIFHKGHEEILKKLKSLEAQPIIFSFYPSPALFFSQNTEKHGEIFTIKQKVKIVKNLKLSMFVQKFTSTFANLNAEEFILLLIEKLKMRHLVVGEDFLFGKNQSGNIETLKILAKKYSFTLHTIPLFSAKTTNLRETLQSGNIQDFNKSLAFDIKYEISGVVLKGLGLAGKVLGFKTANIILKSTLSLPKFGVYKCSVLVAGKKYKGIANIGTKPTLESNVKPVAEVHILNFNENIYGTEISIAPETLIREEQKFNTLEDLKKQIEKDISSLSYKINNI